MTDTDPWIGLPEHIKVGYRDMEVRLVETDTNLSMHNAMGSFNSRKGVIALDAEVAGVEGANTLIHEVLHAIWRVWGLPHETDEETAVNALANGLTAVLRDNPELTWFVAAQFGHLSISEAPDDYEGEPVEE